MAQSLFLIGDEVMSLSNFIKNRFKSVSTYSVSDPTFKEIARYVEDIKSECLKIYKRKIPETAKFKSESDLINFVETYPIDNFVHQFGYKRTPLEFAELIMYTPSGD